MSTRSNSIFVSLLASAATWLLASTASADFCAGKANGYWCDGALLRLCSGGTIAGSQTCSCGCQPMPPGVDDACSPCGGGFCSNLGNGLYCNGDVLTNCQGGAVAGTQNCQCGCDVMPPGTPDACSSCGGGFCSGKSNGLYCDGNVLTNCSGGSVASTQNCQCGCSVMPSGTPDVCSTCGGNDFCTGKENGAFCDGSVLTTCSAGKTASTQSCTCGCSVKPPGTPDVCSSCGGGSSDFCNGKQDGAWCNNGGLTTCSGGKTASTTPCPNGCESKPVGTPDQCAAGASGFCSGKTDGSYCNDATLVECGGGAQVAVKTCASGCLVIAGDLPDVCVASGGDFCTDKSNGYWCNANLLVGCKDHAQQSTLPCSEGCMPMPDGQDDYCKTSSPNVPPGQSITVAGEYNQCATVSGNLNLYAGRGLPVFDQTDYPQKLGTCSNKTIANWGCLITSMSMLYAYYNTGRPVDGIPMADPVVENDWRTNNGGYFDGCYADIVSHNPPGMVSYYNYDVNLCPTGWSAKVIADSLMNGNPVVAGVRYTPCPASEQCFSDHWVLIVGADDKGFIFNDPYKGKANIHFNEGGKPYMLYEFVTYGIGGGGGGFDGQGRPISGTDWHPGPVTPPEATALPEASAGCSFGSTGAAASGASLVAALILLASRRRVRA